MNGILDLFLKSLNISISFSGLVSSLRRVREKIPSRRMRQNVTTKIKFYLHGEIARAESEVEARKNSSSIFQGKREFSVSA